MSEIQIVDNWVICLSNQSNDWCLKTIRGIICEDHVQIVSYHTTNTPTEEEIIAAIEPAHQIAIDSFIDICKDIRPEESFGLIFMHCLLKDIVEKATRNRYKAF